MSITQKYKKEEGESGEEGSGALLEDEQGEPGEGAPLARPTGTGALVKADDPANARAAEASVNEEDDEEYEDEDAAPAQFGTKRFVYAAYFGGAIGIAFLVSKLLHFAWGKLSQYQPVVGEPHDEAVMPIAAAVGLAAAIYYWKRTRARELAEEVADELSKVTWPSKQEVTNGTAVVLVTTALATIFFALMDRFWGFVTNLVYGS
ncbi:preprotein translocase subunit SecE [Pendulispora albinea]|uniref:Protein translocase subunit SecE n=1 Tax=Pendulispora albinea TaxID=2741071 RepID=A0ABZ2M5L5_9BACT